MSALTENAGLVASQRAAGEDAMLALEKRTMRRVALRVMPFILACYLVSFLDRVNVGFAALQMNADLGFTPAVYGLGAGLAFVTYCLLEVPSNLVLYRVGARRWLPTLMLIWGSIAVGMAFITTATHFYTMRLLLGAAEAGFFPGVMFFLTLWFPVAFRGRAIGVFTAGIALSGVIGAPLSGALLSMQGIGGLHGWQWMFILEGLPAILLAPCFYFFLQDSPADAGWMTAAERSWLANRLESEAAQRKAVRTYSVGEALVNPKVLLLAALYFSNVCVLNGILFFLPLTVRSFGLSYGMTGLVAAIPSLVALIVIIWIGWRSDAQRERYGHAAVTNLIGGVALLASTLIADPTARIAAISVSLAAIIGFSPAFWAIPGTFLSGAAAAGGIAIISSLGVLGGFVAPSVIGAIATRSGDFRLGLGLFAVIAIAMSLIFYFIGRRHQASFAAALASRESAGFI